MLQDEIFKYWELTLSVQKIRQTAFESCDISYEYLIVYDQPGSGNHCIYVSQYNKDSKEIHCINSYGYLDEKPVVHINDVKLFYRVNSSTVEKTRASVVGNQFKLIRGTEKLYSIKKHLILYLKEKSPKQMKSVLTGRHMITFLIGRK